VERQRAPAPRLEAEMEPAEPIIALAHIVDDLALNKWPVE